MSVLSLTKRSLGGGRGVRSPQRTVPRRRTSGYSGAAMEDRRTSKPTPRRRRRRRGLWRSPLTRRILLVNMLALVIPVLGLLHL